MKECICIEAPMGSNGLEGFEIDKSYQYDWDYLDENMKKKMYCVHLDGGAKGCMKKTVFKRFFKPFAKRTN